MNYFVLAYYKFTPIEDPAAEVLRHHAFFRGEGEGAPRNEYDARGRIYISKEGINGQMSASIEAAEAYMQWMRADPRFAGIEFKIHHYHEHAFPRMTVKVRQQLVAMDKHVRPEDGGEHISAERWKKMLEERDEKTLILDVRNDYEWKVGHFEGAELPKLETFRQFPEFAKRLKETHSTEETKVMMYCTGGIRCELYSALLKEEGFSKVYQLDGGVIKYGLQEGQKHWKGKLFVFDDRLAVPLNENEKAEVISHCHKCDALTDVYYNCANMDCNELFISCPECSEKLKGCCSQECSESPRLRPFEKGDHPKPFRRAHHYATSNSKE
ncbi:MAG: rhodanese-related sulfurtransferase [Chlamydiales bacterium]|nr:rhodanese-related sulfurtransferase [Chlamydiales bacterium]